jgi:hypothetical protein
VALTKVVSYCQSIENVDAKNKNQSKPKKKWTNQKQRNTHFHCSLYTSYGL